MSVPKHLYDEFVRCPSCKARMCLASVVRYGHKLCAFCRPYPRGSK